MDYILNIHSATETAIVNICDGPKVLATLINNDSKQHAAFLHKAIQQILSENKIGINQLKAIGVTNGPGSYTGIRVGLAAAKGLCFALKIPLVTFSALEVMASTAIDKLQNQKAWYCPMIDARRTEVFTAIYNYHLEEMLTPQAMILTENSFKEISQSQHVIFFGSGSEKFKQLSGKINFKFITGEEISTTALSEICWKKYLNNEFADIACSEPLYLKEFHSTVKI